MEYIEQKTNLRLWTIDMQKSCKIFKKYTFVFLSIFFLVYVGYEVGKFPISPLLRQFHGLDSSSFQERAETILSQIFTYLYQGAAYNYSKILQVELPSTHIPTRSGIPVRIDSQLTGLGHVGLNLTRNDEESRIDGHALQLIGDITAR